jgi:hypothetical protein
MSPEERDKTIVEIHTDIKWIKEWTLEHKALHSKYTYYFIATVIGLLVALIR